MKYQKESREVLLSLKQEAENECQINDCSPGVQEIIKQIREQKRCFRETLDDKTAENS